MPFDLVSVLKVPDSVAFGLVALKFPLEISSVWISPLALQEFVLVPLTDVFHSCCRKYISPSSVLFTIQPVSWEHIFVGVNVHSLAVFFSSDPLAIVFTFIGVNQSSDTVFFVSLEFSGINIPVRISIPALTLTMTVYILSLVNLSIWIRGRSLACEILWRVRWLSSFGNELVRLLFFLLLFWHF